jgi:hypothetical protein
VYLQAGCRIDEIAESHIVIQYRVVLENLDRIAATLIDLFHGKRVETVPTTGRKSAVWGQPRFTDYLRWKKAARKSRSATRLWGPALRVASGRLERQSTDASDATGAGWRGPRD